MKTTNYTPKFNLRIRLAVMAAFALMAFVSAVAPAAAQDSETPSSNPALARLAGTWTAGIELNGGCGIGSKQVTFTLNSEGTGPRQLHRQHGGMRPELRAGKHEDYIHQC
jgi:hypothetical protein